MAVLPADSGCETSWLPDPDLSGSPTASQPTTTSSLTPPRHVSSRAHYIVIVALLLLNLLVPFPTCSSPSYNDVHDVIPLSLHHSTSPSSSFSFNSDVLSYTASVHPFPSFSAIRPLLGLDFFSSSSFSQLNMFLSFLTPTMPLGHHLSSLCNTQCCGTYATGPCAFMPPLALTCAVTGLIS